MAATPTNQQFSFQASDVFSEFDQKLQSYWVHIQCVSDVVTEVVAGSEFENVWKETQAVINRLINIEWKRCSKFDSVADQVK